MKLLYRRLQEFPLLSHDPSEVPQDIRTTWRGGEINSFAGIIKTSDPLRLTFHALDRFRGIAEWRSLKITRP